MAKHWFVSRTLHERIRDGGPVYTISESRQIRHDVRNALIEEFGPVRHLEERDLHWLGLDAIAEIGRLV